MRVVLVDRHNTVVTNESFVTGWYQHDDGRWLFNTGSLANAVVFNWYGMGLDHQLPDALVATMNRDYTIMQVKLVALDMLDLQLRRQ